VAGATEVGHVTTVGLPHPSSLSTTSSNSRPMMRLGYAGVARTHRRAMWCWLGAVRSPTERQRDRAVARVSIFADQISS
jgi:hypothetical protein